FFSSRRRHTILVSDWSSDVCSSDLPVRLCARTVLRSLPRRQSRIFLCFMVVVWTAACAFGGSTPPAEAFSVLPLPPSGPQITPYLQYQTELAWREDGERMTVWDGIRTEQDLLRVQKEIHQKLLTMLGGLPTTRTPLHP